MGVLAKGILSALAYVCCASGSGLVTRVRWGHFLCYEYRVVFRVQDGGVET